MKRKNIPNFSKLLEDAIISAENNGIKLKKEELVNLSKQIEERLSATIIIHLADQKIVNQMVVN